MIKSLKTHLPTLYFTTAPWTCLFVCHSPKSIQSAAIVRRIRDQKLACSASDRRVSNFESCIWSVVSSHHAQEVLLAQFSPYVHKSGLNLNSCIHTVYRHFGALKLLYTLPSIMSYHSQFSQMKHVRIKYLAQGHNIETKYQR